MNRGKRAATKTAGKAAASADEISILQFRISLQDVNPICGVVSISLDDTLREIHGGLQVAMGGKAFTFISLSFTWCGTARGWRLRRKFLMLSTSTTPFRSFAAG